MPEAIILYHTYGGLEWGTKYYCGALLTGPEASIWATELAEAEANLFVDDVVITRYEWISTLGVIIAGGTLAEPGIAGGDMQPIRYALFLRLVSTGPGRPSSKYIHGWPEPFQTDNGITGTFTTALAAYVTGLTSASQQLVDSDGTNVTNVTFRGFSRRKRMRRAIV
jgi:hypothetical protein